MRFTIDKLPNSFQFGVEELKQDYSFTTGGNGIGVTAVRSDKLSVKGDCKNIVIGYSKDCEFYRGFRLAFCALRESPSSHIDIEEKSLFDDLGFMSDNANNMIRTMPMAKGLIRLFSVMGYSFIELYTEDAFEVPGEPYFGLYRGSFSQDEIREMDAYAIKFGVEIIPCIQTLAHLMRPKRWQEYKKTYDIDDILLIDEPRTYILIENMFKSVSECFTTKRVNIGMDEPWNLGLGKYRIQHGYTKPWDIFVKHLKKVLEIADKYRLKCRMWGDMFYRYSFNGGYYRSEGTILPEIFEQTPKNVDIIYWDYYWTDRAIYDNMIKNLKMFPNKGIFAGGVFDWWGYVPNNSHAIAVSKPAIDSCIENGIKEVFVTSWGGECTELASLPALVYYAERAYGHDGNCIEKAFKSVTDCLLSDFMNLELPDLIPGIDRNGGHNYSKIFLFNDLFSGIYDILAGDFSEFYLENLKKLKQAIPRTGRFAYLFDIMYALLDAVSVKYNIGVRLRCAYRSGDKNALKEIAADIATAIGKVEIFYTKYRAQWMIENKPHGVEVFDIKLGGLMQRMKACRQTVLDYCGGNIGEIPQLAEDKEELLRQDNLNDPDFIRDNSNRDWHKLVTVTSIK